MAIILGEHNGGAELLHLAQAFRHFDKAQSATPIAVESLKDLEDAVGKILRIHEMCEVIQQRRQRAYQHCLGEPPCLEALLLLLKKHLLLFPAEGQLEVIHEDRDYRLQQHPHAYHDEGDEVARRGGVHVIVAVLWVLDRRHVEPPPANSQQPENRVEGIGEVGEEDGRLLGENSLAYHREDDGHHGQDDKRLGDDGQGGEQRGHDGPQRAGLAEQPEHAEDT
mmetsp:Transcript_2443/g.6659  ORF Transcript_2443/g.6659 Transcript_2443/m.6659 type:complete len:223 (+) Transcript_2443:898-1566(+)